LPYFFIEGNTTFGLAVTFNLARESRIIVKIPQAAIKMPVGQTEPIVVING
jgi:hypothetical protein